MRILCVSHYYVPHVGGLEIAVQNMTQALEKGGHAVSVVTCTHQGMRSGTHAENSVAVHRINAWNFFDTRFGIPFPIPSVSIFRTMWREVRAADVVHIHDVFYPTSWIAYVCAALLHKPLFLTQHVAFVEHPSPFVMRIQRLVYATWGKRIFRAAARIIVHNAVVKEFVSARANSRKVVELRNGIDTSLFRPVKTAKEKAAARVHFGLPERPLILFVGRFVPKKGIDVLFAARDSGYDLVFAGSGEIKKEWADAHDVHILGALSQGDLALAYRAADICVLPSHGELFTLALQEAAASGLPVVTTNERTYAVYDLDRDGIALIDPSPTQITSTIKHILSDDKRRARMKKYSVELAKKRFDREKNSAELLKVYADFADNRRLVTTSWDDGHVLDVRLAHLLKKYGIGGTFYLSPENRELAGSERLSKEQLSALSDFEIGAHTVTHPYLPTVDVATARTEIVASKEIVESWTGTPVTSFCYPKGGYTKRDEKLAESAGYKRARTVERFSLSIGENAYAMPTSIHTYDHYSDIWNLARFVRFNPMKFIQLYRRWDKQAIALFDRMLDEGGVFHLWGHSWEVDRNKDWDRLEKVLAYIGKREGVKYVTNDAL